MSTNQRRPRVICRVMASVDGRIVVEGWPLSRKGSRQYEAVHATCAPDAWICGRVTMEQHFAAGTRPDAEVAREYDGPAREDFVAPGEHGSFAIALVKIGARLGVGTLMLEGRGGINGSFLRAGLIDEVSLLVTPVADRRVGTPALLDVAGDDARPVRLALASVERRADDVLRLRYRVERG